MPPIAWIIIILVTAGWIWFTIAIVRAEKRASAKRWEQYHAVKAAFDALPAPRNPIPTTLRKVTK